MRLLSIVIAAVLKSEAINTRAALIEANYANMCLLNARTWRNIFNTLSQHRNICVVIRVDQKCYTSAGSTGGNNFHSFQKQMVLRE